MDLWICSTWLVGPSPAVSKCISAVLLRGLGGTHHTHHAKGRRKLAVTHRACTNLSPFSHAQMWKASSKKKLESTSWQRGHSAITYPVPEPPEAQSRSHQKDIWSKSLNFKFCFNCQTIDALVEDCLFSQHCCRTTVPHPSLNSTQVCCCFSIRFHLQSAAITGR